MPIRFVNIYICYRAEPTALPLRPGKVLLARIETIALSCAVFRGANRRPLWARGATVDLPRSYSYTNPTEGGSLSINHPVPLSSPTPTPLHPYPP